MKGRTPLRIQAARVGGVEIPNQKFAEFSLQYIYGIGHTTAKAILIETVRQSNHSPASAHASVSRRSTDFPLEQAFTDSMPMRRVFPLREYGI